MSEWRASAGAAPWTRPRWFESAERWLRSCLASLGYEPTGPVARVQVWELSCILRVPTAQGDVYFKATADSPLFANEGVVMRVLAELFGDRVPRPLAVDAERRWMLLADFGEQLGGDGHGAGVAVEVREDVLRAFARLQVALHQAISYRSIVANLEPPIDRHMMESTASWLRQVLTAPLLADPGGQA